MTDVFISYKRDDELRVAQLVQALQKQGLSIWWDRGLPGGESWRANIETALNQARCAVVVWTHASTGAAGGFVKDEAARAARRRILVPVMLDKVEAPLGFGELQAIDLTRWRGSARDPFVLDLVAAIRAKMEGRAVPLPLGPMKRLRRRLTVGGAVSALALLGSAFAANTLSLQERTCGVPLAQPWLADTCGTLGLGGKPVREERIAWQQRPNGDCDALRQHIKQFPEGAYRAAATAMLSARKVTVAEQWLPAQRPLRLAVGRDATPAATAAAARADAMERGRKKAQLVCQDFGAAGLARYRSADVEPQEWQCDAITGGTVCGFEGKALCGLEEVSRAERETCDAAAAR